MQPAVEHELAIILTGLINACRAASDGEFCYCDAAESLDGQLCHVCKCEKAVKRAVDFNTKRLHGQTEQPGHEPTKQGT